MNKTTIISCILILIGSLLVKGQQTYTTDLNPIPISLIQKYKDIINPSSLKPNFVTDSYDNDSLFQVENTNRDSNSDTFIGGINKEFDREMWFKKTAYKFEVDTGTIWLFKVSTLTGKAVGVVLDSLNLPEGSQLSYFYYLPEEQEPVYKIHGVDGINLTFGVSIITNESSELYIEYFECNHSKFDFKIRKWIYLFATKTVNSLDYTTNNESSLKSGRHGTSKLNTSSCNNDINCYNSITNRWREMAETVFYIRLSYNDINSGKTYISEGSGVFVNKGGLGYVANDKPFMLTVKHVFVISLGNGKYIDLTTKTKSEYDQFVYVDYKNDVCNSTRTITGKYVSGNFDVITSGNSYNTNDPSYRQNDDYALLQYNKTMEKFSKYGVLFAGWQGQLCNLAGGIASFGHPHGDVMKVCVDTDPISISTLYHYLILQYNVGIGEEGMSGGPLFNFTKDLIGINATKDSGGSCGDNSTVCTAGNFEYIYDNICSYIDPEHKCYALSKSYSDLTPSHCHNCILDASLGETGVDCGGDCFPCHIPDNANLETKSDFIRSDKVNARYDISVSPSTSVDVDNLAKEFNAGDEITFSKNITFNKGATLTAELKSSLVEEDYPRSCDSPCISIANVTTPNKDGINDFLVMGQHSVVMYIVKIFDRAGKTLFDSGEEYILEDALVNIYDASPLKSGYVYFYYVQAWNCADEKVTERGFFHVFK